MLVKSIEIKMASSNNVIVGAGIIGLSTAYYLSESPRTQAQNIHLVDSSPDLFECASGYAAGFLAADCTMPPPTRLSQIDMYDRTDIDTGFSPSTAALGRLSFNLHKELAAKHNGREKWGYIPSTGTSYTQSRSPAKTRKRRSTDWIMDASSRANAAIPRIHESANEETEPPWLTRYEGDDLEILSKGETTAQVDPRRLCKWLLDRCTERGVKLHQPGRVLSVSCDARDELAGVRVLSVEDGVETDSESYVHLESLETAIKHAC
jgi:glycine/D-amino acid oxidase-like deaminating enzyme